LDLELILYFPKFLNLGLHCAILFHFAFGRRDLMLGQHTPFGIAFLLVFQLPDTQTSTREALVQVTTLWSDNMHNLLGIEFDQGDASSRCLSELSRMLLDQMLDESLSHSSLESDCLFTSQAQRYIAFSPPQLEIVFAVTGQSASPMSGTHCAVLAFRFTHLMDNALSRLRLSPWCAIHSKALQREFLKVLLLQTMNEQTIQCSHLQPILTHIEETAQLPHLIQKLLFRPPL